MTIIIFLIILGLLVLSHEFGHFYVAKKSGARVDEFGFGFPPRIWSRKYGETTYSLNLIPFGGFVKIYGEDPDEESLTGRDRKRAMSAQSKWRQALVLVAGVTANLILAWLLLIIAFATTGLPTRLDSVPTGYTLENPQVTIVHVEPKSPAALGGLMAGDQIVHLRTIEGRLTDPSVGQVQEYIKSHADSEIVVGYIRNHGPSIKPTIAEVAVRPMKNEASGQAVIGVGLDTIGQLHLPIHRSILAGTQSTWHLLSGTVIGLGTLVADLFGGKSGTLDQVTGPIGLVGLVGDASAMGFGYLLLFTALISINLAVLNLLPIPALDGGRLLFLLIERIKGRPITPKIANAVNMGGFIALMALMLLVTYSDIIKFFT